MQFHEKNIGYLQIKAESIHSYWSNLKDSYLVMAAYKGSKPQRHDLFSKSPCYHLFKCPLAGSLASPVWFN